MAKAAPVRTYSSPLRAEQAEQTRERIVQAAVDLLSEGDAGDLSMPDVAARAGVSVRTVYRSFASKDELLDGVIDWINEYFSQGAGVRPTSRREHEDTAVDAMRVVFELEPLYRALFATRAGRASHRRTNRREQDLRAGYATEIADLDEEQVRRFLAVLHVVASSNAALFMKDYWDLSADDAGQAIQWAIRVLADAVSDPKQREGL